ncbi:hypothetical protein BC830DRAFT_1175340 [Chytriomyces sp. MP71]|nr:hypothetical protein BC830DRAFT_1175340 [Chytriomyces sp. MP71]
MPAVRYPDPSAPLLSEITPPSYASVDHSDAMDQLEAFKVLVAKHEISNLFALKLRKLETYNIVIIADDSGSMNVRSTNGLSVTNPFAVTSSRWDELKSTVQMVTEIASTLDQDGIDVYFLNRAPIRNIVGPSIALDKAFERPPEGYTPIKRVLKQVLNEKWRGVQAEDRKKLLVLIATDGEPTTDTGQDDKQGLRDVLMRERGERGGEVAVSFLVCTDDDAEIEYLNEWDNHIPDLDVVDDYHSERRQIQGVQEAGFPFSRGDWVCKMLLGAIDPEVDILDEMPVQQFRTLGHGSRRTSHQSMRTLAKDNSSIIQKA